MLLYQLLLSRIYFISIVVPLQPEEVKLETNETCVLVNATKPKEPNGVITHYTVSFILQGIMLLLSFQPQSLFIYTA